jgi:exopolysaccharide biosynthesis WecB/TagA/CpsF family protein
MSGTAQKRASRQELWIRQLVSALNIIHTRREEAAFFDRIRQLDRPLVVSFLNAHGFNLAFGNPAFRNSLARSSFLLRDGIGMQLLLQLNGIDPGRNMNGTDLIPRIINRLRRKRIAVFGTTRAVAVAASARLRRWGANPVLVEDGFHEPAYYLDKLRSRKVDVVLLGMGMPKQELLSNRIARLRKPLLVINGGAILDFMAGRASRAPLLLRRAGLEWLYRLYREPRRLWRRYVIGNVVFLAHALTLRFGPGSEALTKA